MAESKYKLGDMVAVRDDRGTFINYTNWLSGHDDLLFFFDRGVYPEVGSVGEVVRIAPHLTQPNEYGMILGIRIGTKIYIIEDCSVERAGWYRTNLCPEVTPPHVPTGNPHETIINMALTLLAEKLTNDYRFAQSSMFDSDYSRSINLMIEDVKHAMAYNSGFIK